MSRTFCNLILLLGVVLGFCGRAFAAPTPIGSVTITGAEQSSGGVWDTGTITATINGVSVSIAYNQYSTPAGIASALGATISQKCSMPVYAHAVGAVLSFYPKGTNVINSATLSSTSSNTTLFPQGSFPENNTQIFPTTPIIALATSGSSSTYGISVTFTATFSSGSGPTGSVSFYDGSSLIGTGQISGTTASYTTNTLTVGAHSITASYPGNGSYYAATSNAITQTITKATPTISLSTSATGKTVYGTAVTLTATVTPSIATGSVTFTSGSTNLGTVNISSGTASLTTKSLPAGANTIIASYSGDANDSPSTGHLQSPITVSPVTLSIVPQDQSAPYGGPSPNLTQSTAYQITVSDGSAIVEGCISGTPELSIGPDSNGDAYNPATSPINDTFPITVTQGSFAVNISACPQYSSSINMTAQATLKIVLDTPTIAIEAPPVPYGQNQTVNVTVKNQNNNVIPTGTLTLTIWNSDGQNITPDDVPVSTLTNGAAGWQPCPPEIPGGITLECPVLPVGNYTINATYSGDSFDNPVGPNQFSGVLQIVPSKTTTTITSPSCPNNTCPSVTDEQANNYTIQVIAQNNGNSSMMTAPTAPWEPPL